MIKKQLFIRAKSLLPQDECADKSAVSIQLWLALIVYPVVLALVSIFLIREMGAKGPIAVAAAFSTFIFIAGVFSLIPALIIFIFTLPVFLLSKKSDKVEKAAAIVKIASAFLVIDSILLFLSLYMF